MPKRIAVVDGANIAYAERSEKGDSKISNLLAVRATLEQKGYETVMIVDASLLYEIDDRPSWRLSSIARLSGRRRQRPTPITSSSKWQKSRMH